MANEMLRAQSGEMPGALCAPAYYIARQSRAGGSPPDCAANKENWTMIHSSEWIMV
jgi:hypothetical protein